MHRPLGAYLEKFFAMEAVEGHFSRNAVAFFDHHQDVGCVLPGAVTNELAMNSS